jgi:hypothetical protein
MKIYQRTNAPIFDSKFHYVFSVVIGGVEFYRNTASTIRKRESECDRSQFGYQFWFLKIIESEESDG